MTQNEKIESEFRAWFAQQLKDVLPDRAALLKQCEGNMRDAFYAGITAAKWYA